MGRVTRGGMLLLAVGFLLLQPAFFHAADEGPDETLRAAIDMMEDARILIENAEAIAENIYAGRDDLRLAVSLYASAGEKFEAAGNILEKIPWMIKREYIDHCRNATKYCINAIEKCKIKYNGTL